MKALAADGQRMKFKRLILIILYEILMLTYANLFCFLKKQYV